MQYDKSDIPGLLIDDIRNMRQVGEMSAIRMGKTRGLQYRNHLPEDRERLQNRQR